MEECVSDLNPTLSSVVYDRSSLVGGVGEGGFNHKVVRIVSIVPIVVVDVDIKFHAIAMVVGYLQVVDEA